jgi:NSS family neurotransmitter:Na+ symporter
MNGVGMSDSRGSIHGQWSSRWAFFLAATGSAVGLGNIWKFPYITGENGGGAFVLVYLICIAIIGIPIMMAEIMIGRRGRRSPINTMRILARQGRHNPRWQYLGWGGVVAGFLIISYYSVIAGWAMAYVFRAAGSAFDGATADGVASIFSALVSDPERLLAWHTIFMAMTIIVVSRGVASGLEKAVRYLMPALFILLVLLLGYSMTTGAFMQGFAFMFNPNFSALTGQGVLIAMGHAFFTLSLGMGAIMVYGSYLSSDTSIAKVSIAIALADTAVALIAGLAIFPLVFANHLEPSSGPGLIFQTLPLAFGHMPGGALFGTLFFILLVFAAWTSAISLIEPAVTWLVETLHMPRLKATVYSGLAAWLLGMGTIFSFNIWSKATINGKTFFELLDYLTANIMLPLGGLAISLFAGWIMVRGSVRDELKIQHPRMFQIWYTLVRYVTPVAVIIVFFSLQR